MPQGEKQMLNEFPDRVTFTSDWLQCNNYWLFAVARRGDDAGRLFFRSNTDVSGVPGAWARFGKTGRPIDDFKRDPDRPIVRIDMDNDVLLAITEGGLVYRVLDTFESDPEKFFWRKSWGWPFDEGPQMRIKRGYRELCFSSSKEWSTMWTADLDGNRHSRFIDHMYCLSSEDTLIHHNDPWTPGDWAYAFPSPEGGRLLPSRGSIAGLTAGINASGGVLGFIAPNGVWTIEYDFDIAGGNPLAEYVPHPLTPYEGIAPIVRFEKGARPIRFPSAPWRYQGPLPGPCTAHIQVSPEWDRFGKVVPGPDSRIIRILGLGPSGGAVADVAAVAGAAGTVGGAATVPGYWEKRLTDAAWRFVPWDGYARTDIERDLINGREPEYGPCLTRDWVSRERRGSSCALSGFGLRSNFFEPARFTLTTGSGSIAVDLYAHIQMRTSRAGRALARLRGRRAPQWLGAFVVFPADDSPLVRELKRLMRARDGDRYAHLLLRARRRRIELIKPILPLNADIANALNRLLGKRIAVLREAPSR